ncbi:MAG: GAF domain-containing protein [Elusimicrobia bacterium]|nr:GAF domain-containing protein [Elusimicrobiota bacterium]
MPLGLFHYQLLAEILEKIHFIYNDEELANTILASVAGALNAEGGSIFKILPDGTIFPLASFGATIESLRQSKFETGKGVVGWVAQFAQPVKVDDPVRDTRFTGSIDTTTGFKTRSILAAPILGRGKAIGVIEFLNRKGGPFAAPDLELVSMLGREIGIAFENGALFERLEEGRAFQESVVNSLSAGVVMVDLKLRLRKVNAMAKKMLWLEYTDSEGEVGPAVNDVLRAYPPLLKVLQDVVVADAPSDTRKLSLQIGGLPVELAYKGVPIFSKKGVRLGSALLLQGGASKD